MKELIINEWKKDNIDIFNNILLSYKNGERIAWTQNIVNTNKNCLAIPSNMLRDISKSIYKGNYISFLELMPHEYHESLIVDAYLISKIKDFKIQKKYILKIAKYIDNWAVVDTIKFNVKGYERDFIELSKKLAISDKPFYRRIAIRILFSFVSNKDYLKDVFSIMDSFYLEEHYYVNMANAWLLCELFIKNRDETINYLKNHHLNKFTINKGISKCRDSFRVSKEDKEMLLKYRIKE